MDQANSNLFTVLNQGTLNIKNSMRKAIVMVGLTRAGKSTAFNWVLKKPMIG